MLIQSSVEVFLNREDHQNFSVLSQKAFFNIFHILIAVFMSLMQHVTEMHSSLSEPLENCTLHLTH